MHCTWNGVSTDNTNNKNIQTYASAVKNNCTASSATTEKNINMQCSLNLKKIRGQSSITNIQLYCPSSTDIHTH